MESLKPGYEQPDLQSFDILNSDLPLHAYWTVSSLLRKKKSSTINFYNKSPVVLIAQESSFSLEIPKEKVFPQCVVDVLLWQVRHLQ